MKHKAVCVVETDGGEGDLVQQKPSVNDEWRCGFSERRPESPPELAPVFLNEKGRRFRCWDTLNPLAQES